MATIIKKGELPSHAFHLNYFSRHSFDDTVLYVMDNHLAAFWTFHQLNLDESYNFLHIDRHYDLVKYNKVQDRPIHNIDWRAIPIQEITSYRTMNGVQRHQLIRWDNYIMLFYHLHPHVFRYGLFVTQKVGQMLFPRKKAREIEMYELFREEFEGDVKWVFNIDADVFFTRVGDDWVQLYSDRFIAEFGDWLYEQAQYTAQINICLSPEACGGWEYAKRVARLILRPFGVRLKTR